jgi:hypothetical protein
VLKRIRVFKSEKGGKNNIVLLEENCEQCVYDIFNKSVSLELLTSKVLSSNQVGKNHVYVYKQGWKSIHKKYKAC